jgi:hypothetical protein
MSPAWTKLQAARWLGSFAGESSSRDQINVRIGRRGDQHRIDRLAAFVSYT